MRRLALWLIGVLALLAVPASAGAVNLEDFKVSFEGSGGEAAMEAGAHPFALRNSFDVATVSEGGETFPAEAVKDLRIDLPPGFAGTPTATLRCEAANFLLDSPAVGNWATGCPDGSVVGTVKNEVGEAGETVTYVSPVYNLLPAPGYAARLGFRVDKVRVTIDLTVSESTPYRVEASIHNITQVLEFYSTDFTVWGDPAAKVHDPYRGACLATTPDAEGKPQSLGGECSAGIPEEAFLVNPRACEGPLASSWQTISWDDPAKAPATGSMLTDDPLTGAQRGFAGCAELPFAPSLGVQPTSHSAQSASGLQVGVEVPHNEGLTDPAGRAASDIKQVRLTLPEGMTVNPSQAEGLATCSEADLARESAGSAPGAGCPQASKIGTVSVHTPLLPEEAFEGELFVATPYENPFGSLIALYMTVKNPQRGVGIALAGKVEPDPRTGQLITTFGDPSSSDPAFRVLPQLPFSSVSVHLREGGRSPLITPPGCGSFTASAQFTPWANPEAPQTVASTFQIDSGVGGGPCPSGAAPFDPGFEAGTESNQAKSFSPFLMRLTRGDGEQDMTRFSALLPRGVGGIIAGLERCPDASIAAARARTGAHGGREELDGPSCPASSRIGSTLAAAGVGSQLTYVPGSLYLAGPYDGDPLSVVAITPAVAGPFDAGTVVVRVGLTLDPRSGQVRTDGAASDPIPHILKGIPLNVRELRVRADRPEFTFNATSCKEETARATLWGGGTSLLPMPDSPVDLSARYQAAGCAALGFKPRLALSLRGGVRRGAHPALRAVVTPRPQDANFSRAVVTLPHSAFLDQAHIRTICTRVQFAAGEGNGSRCPKGSIYGHARAWTPIVGHPAEGPVLLRSSNHNLPDLVIALEGPPEAAAHVELSARIDSVHGGIRTSFESIPDLPVSRFVLDMRGGAKGLIVNSRNLCRKAGRNRAHANLTGQNGRRSRARPPVRAVRCAKAAKRHHHRHHRRRGSRG